MLLRSHPLITESDKESIVRVLTSGNLDAPEVVYQLEQKWASMIGAKYCIAVNSCTSALHLSLLASGVCPGDEVLVPSFTFHGTTHPVLYVGAEPVFCDIDVQTFNFNPDQIDEHLTSRTRAIIPVHLHGLMCDMEDIMAIANEHNLIVVEDACQAHLSKQGDKFAGTFGLIGCFSMSKTKNLTGGQGGLIVTDDEEIYNRIRKLMRYGEIQDSELGRSYIVDEVVGLSSTISGLCAALALSQLDRLEGYIENGVRNAEIVSLELLKEGIAQPPYEPTGFSHTWHKYRFWLNLAEFGITKLHDYEFRNKLFLYLKESGLVCDLWQKVLIPEHPIYGRCVQDVEHAFPNALRVLRESLYLFNEQFPIIAQDEETALFQAKLLVRLLKEYKHVY